MENEVCGSATLIQVQESVPFLYNGSTSQISPVGEFNAATACSYVSAFTRGVWYKIEGDERCYTASTRGSTFDTVVAVYNTTAGCQGLSCLAENDDYEYEYEYDYDYEYDYGLSLTSEVFWATAVGVDYYLFVAGLGEASGDYALSVAVCASSCICSSWSEE